MFPQTAIGSRSNLICKTENEVLCYWKRVELAFYQQKKKKKGSADKLYMQAWLATGTSDTGFITVLLGSHILAF